jgi:hypothetical protein
VTFTDNGNGTALLAGIPSANSGGSYAFTITAHNGIGSNASQSFTLVVAQPAVITSGNAVTFTTGQTRTFTVAASGFPKPALSEAGGLPGGVVFHDNGNGTATLSGVPASGTGATYSVVITAHNGVGTDATQSFTLTVNQPPAISTGSTTTFTVGSPGGFSVASTGFPTPVLSETGNLPSGITFTDHGDGTASLAGTPTAGSGANYVLSITAHNGSGPDATQSFTLTIDEPAAITSANTATFTVGTPGSFTVHTTGFPMPAVGEAGSLPAGVSFTDNGDGTASVAGTPSTSTAGIFSFTITAQNGVGGTASQSFTLTVNQAVAITTGNSTTFTAVSLAAFTVRTTGFPTPALSETGGLPGGVSFVDNQDGTAALAGTPNAGTGGTYVFTITAHGASGDATQDFTLTVDEAASVTSPATSTFTTGSAGTFSMAASGFPKPTLTVGGSLPSGVTFTDSGNGSATLAGTPAASTGGPYALTITAHNGVASDATQSFVLTVDQAPAITSAGSVTFTAASLGAFTVTSVGFPRAAITETGAMPSGVAFTDNGNGTAALVGTPAIGMGGTYPVTITAHNGIGSDATQTFMLTVNQAAAITSAAATSFAAA